MPQGKLKKFVSDKGFGFISPETGGDDIFAHTLQYNGRDPDSLREGDIVTFETEWDDKKPDLPLTPLVGRNVQVFSFTANRWMEAQVIACQLPAGLVTVEYFMHGRLCRKHVPLSSCRWVENPKRNTAKPVSQRSMHAELVSNRSSEEELEEQDPDAYAFAEVVDEEQDWHSNYQNPLSLVEFTKFGDVRWLRSRYLFDLRQSGHKMVRYQELPPHAYYSPKELQQLISEMRIDTDSGRDDLMNQQFMVVAVSHPWWRCEEPDPDREQLQQVCRFLESLLDDGDGIVGEAAVFVDYCSLPQHNWFHPLLQELKNIPKDEQAARWPKPGEHEAVRTLSEQRVFERGLRHMDLIYAHDKTWVLCLDSEIPANAPKTRSYSKRAWCHFERTCGMLKATLPGKHTVSFSHFQKFLDPNWYRENDEPDYEDGDEWTYYWTTISPDLPQIVDTPDQLFAKLEHMQMMSAQTLDCVSAAYSRLYHARVPVLTRLELRQLLVTDIVQLAESLVNYMSLEELFLDHCEFDQKAVQALYTNLVHHWKEPRPRLCVVIGMPTLLSPKLALRKILEDVETDTGFLVEICSDIM